MKIETPNTVHGRLLEAVHISGYTFERAYSELKWLLEDSRWKTVGGGFENVNEFLSTIDFSEFRIAVEKRKELVKSLKDIEASQRTTAKMLGVDEITVARDLGKKRSTTNVASVTEKTKEVSAKSDGSATNVAPWFSTVDNPADLAQRKARNEAKQERKEDKLAVIANVGAISIDQLEIRHCSMEELLTDATGIDAIVTDPPYGANYIATYGKLAELAKRALKQDGILAVMTGQFYLPEIFSLMAEHIPYRWTMAYLTPGGQSPQIWPRRVNTFWKPVLLFGGSPEWVGDVVRSDVNDNDKRYHAWGQAEAGMARVVEALTLPGQLVCDPFVGGGTTAVVCARLGRPFKGCDTDKKAAGISLERASAECWK